MGREENRSRIMSEVEKSIAEAAELWRGQPIHPEEAHRLAVAAITQCRREDLESAFDFDEVIA